MWRQAFLPAAGGENLGKPASFTIGAGKLNHRRTRNRADGQRFKRQSKLVAIHVQAENHLPPRPMFIDVAAGRLYKGQNLWQEKHNAARGRNQIGVINGHADTRWGDALRSRPQSPGTRPRRSVALQLRHNTVAPVEAQYTATTERGPPVDLKTCATSFERNAPNTRTSYAVRDY